MRDNYFLNRIILDVPALTVYVVEVMFSLLLLGTVLSQSLLAMFILLITDVYSPPHISVLFFSQDIFYIRITHVSPLLLTKFFLIVTHVCRHLHFSRPSPSPSWSSFSPLTHTRLTGGKGRREGKTTESLGGGGVVKGVVGEKIRRGRSGILKGR